MQQAFIGELTAAWEPEHAYEIATHQAWRERLPGLVLVDFMHERQRRRPKDPVLITSLMKYVFLLQKESTTGQVDAYHFILTSMAPSLVNSIKISKHWQPTDSSLWRKPMKRGRKFPQSHPGMR
jgi:hypothetical protein